MARINKKNDDIDAGLDKTEELAFFPEAGRGKTLLHIVNLAKFNPGIILLMGDKGSGRRFLLQKLALRVNQKPGLLVIIDRVVKTKLDLYRAIAESFSLSAVEGESVDVLEERALEFLQGSFVTHRPVILAAADIHQFSISMLEELIKLLRRYKKINLLLVGDNNLSAMLKHIDTGKSVRHEILLQPLNRGEMRQFINWRLPFSVDDREFEDIVNTTKGNFALLEREAQKKELAHQGRQSDSRKGLFRSVRLTRRSGLLLAALIIVASAATYYLSNDIELYHPMQAEQTPPPVIDAVVTEGQNKDALVDRQLELLTAAPADITPETRVPEPVVIEKQPVDESVIVPEPMVKPVQPLPAPVVAESVVTEPVVAEPVVHQAPVIPAPVDPVQKTPALTVDDDSGRLLSMDARHYSIQLLGGQSKKTIDRFIETHKGEMELFYFRTERDGKDWYVVMCGEYESRQAAIQATAGLPESLKKTSPWPRRMSEVHALINARTPR